MIEFLRPEALLLAPLAALVLRGRLWPRPLLGVVRVAVLVLLTALLAEPSFGSTADGRDFVFVIDRSRSMPAGHLALARELAEEVAAALSPGDRIGVVAFGREAMVVAHPDAVLRWPDDLAAVDPDGSDLAAGLATALGLVEAGRQATFLVWSDGEVPAAAAEAVARRALRRGIRIDVRPVVRSLPRDTAVHALRVPAESPIDAPFAVTATVLSTAAVVAPWRMLADGEVVRTGTVELRSGRNELQLQHTLRTPGEHRLALEVSAPGDRAPRNDRGLAVVRGIARTRVLCVTPAGRADRLTGSLAQTGFEIVVRAPGAAPLTLGELDGFAAVVIEDVPAVSLPVGAMRDLATWVRDLGGGLLMTGGYRSYGVGGYYQSPIEDVLPISMEIREEQRRFGLAMAIALDRSGSMRASAGGLSKMELANRGAASAIELLSPIDEVSVLAVDTDAHVVVARQPVDDGRQLGGVVGAIEPGGGGIYIGAALQAAVEQLWDAPQQHRHIVLFADASDAEEPGDYEALLPELVRDGFTVSVIGLGSERDPDAPLLQRIARLGEGRCQFVADATELPRVFAQETIQVARSSIVEEPVRARVLPPLGLLGELPAEVPALGGYTVAWLRDRAEMDLEAIGEQGGPLLAHWQVGLGRAAAFLGEADGVLSGEWAAWDGYGAFFATLVRWLCGAPPHGLFVDAHRDGDVAVYRLEVAAEQAPMLADVRGRCRLPNGDELALTVEHLAPGQVELRAPLRMAGVHRAAVQVAGETVRLPPMCRPYSAEWALQPDPRSGERTLRHLAMRTSGKVSPSISELLAGPRRSLGRRDLTAWCAIAALLLFVGEIALRRLRVFVPRRGRGRVREGVVAAPTTTTGAAETDGEPDDRDLLAALERARRRGRR